LILTAITAGFPVLRLVSYAYMPPPLTLLPIRTVWGPRASLRLLPLLAQSIANKAKVAIEIFSTSVQLGRS
jgi:hypothetical protein